MVCSNYDRSMFGQTWIRSFKQKDIHTFVFNCWQNTVRNGGSANRRDQKSNQNQLILFLLDSKSCWISILYKEYFNLKTINFSNCLHCLWCYCFLDRCADVVKITSKTPFVYVISWIIQNNDLIWNSCIDKQRYSHFKRLRKFFTAFFSLSRQRPIGQGSIGLTPRLHVMRGNRIMRSI